MTVHLNNKLTTVQSIENVDSQMDDWFYADWERTFLTREEGLLSIQVQINDENTEMVLLVRDIIDAANHLRTCGTA